MIRAPLESERGQSSVDFLGAFPALLITALAVFQLLALGYSKVLAGDAAEAGALAAAGGRDAVEAARRALPGWSRAHMRVAVRGGQVAVQLRPPTPLRSLGRSLEVRAVAESRLP